MAFKKENSEISKVFNNSEFGNIRVTGTPDNPLFCLVDICKILGIENPSTVKSRIDEEYVQLIDLQALNFSEGRFNGNTKTNFVNESGLYTVLLRSNSPKAKPFSKWVTSEVLPSIRKHGMYIGPDKIEEILLNPDAVINYCIQIKEAREKLSVSETKNKVLSAATKRMKPKEKYYDEHIGEKEFFSTNDLAVELGIDYGKLLRIIKNSEFVNHVEKNTSFRRAYIGTKPFCAAKSVKPEYKDWATYIVTSTGTKVYKWTKKGRENIIRMINPNISL